MSTFDASAAQTATNTYVSHMQDAADAAIARLTTSATSWTIDVLTAVSNLTLPALTTANGTKPSLTPLTLPTFTPSDFSGLVAPTLPSAPSLAGGTTVMWSETFWTNLKAKLAAFTDNITGADDVNSAVDTLSSELTRMNSALFAKDYERRSQILRDLYSAADSGTGAKGFSHPNSMTTALRMDAQQKFQFDLSQTSRDIVTHIFEWAKSNYQFAITQGVAAHNADVEFNVRYLDTTVKVYTATVSALVDKYRTDVAAEVSEAEIKVKEYVTLFAQELDKHKTLTDIQIKEAGFDVEVAKTNALIVSEEWKNKVEDFKARVYNFLETARLNLDNRDRNIKNQVQAAGEAAKAAGAMAQAASTITLNTAGA